MHNLKILLHFKYKYMLKIFSLLTHCKQFSIGWIKILLRFSIGRYNPSSHSRKCPFDEFGSRD